ncbi:TraR/DksA C4-type zinc finger protein [Pseudomonas sp. Irchel 3A5]|uniref:TraR/DksA C4-type zinc finger protein n=1 Tax=Pseudomonas sp. Irchel 3A5 TaxID=2008911 RepID=UPI000BA36DD6|nr:TraR/DksA C4-type zinc finger protein [Pseudomonas sp. Irchel 3A5]
MADVIDIANDQADYFLQVALDRRKRSLVATVSAEDCEDCGEPIPEPRRVAVLGCGTCIDCQAIRERRR